MRLIYLPLEPYEERYTAQLEGWTVDRFLRAGVDLVTICGNSLPDSGRIRTGVALDAHGRTYWALTQTAKLVSYLRDGPEVTNEDVIYSQDMFHPGWEAIPYILAQTGQRPRCYTHCLAQTVDPNDFTFPMRKWMRHFEHLADLTHAGIFLASQCQVPMMQAALLDTATLHVVGLPFDRDEVRSRVPVRLPLHERPDRVVFTSRWDREKQPHFFMDLVETAKVHSWKTEFAICTGSKTLRSNDPSAVTRARKLQQEGMLKIFEGLAKTDYYRLLAYSRVQFNCALQDFVSNTLLEASALGTPSLLPSWLSFPEAVSNNPRQLYRPWGLLDAMHRLKGLLVDPVDATVTALPADTHHRTLDKVLEVLINDSRSPVGGTACPAAVADMGPSLIDR